MTFLSVGARTCCYASVRRRGVNIRRKTPVWARKNWREKSDHHIKSEELLSGYLALGTNRFFYPQKQLRRTFYIRSLNSFLKMFFFSFSANTFHTLRMLPVDGKTRSDTIWVWTNALRKSKNPRQMGTKERVACGPWILTRFKRWMKRCKSGLGRTRKPSKREWLCQVNNK